MQLGPYHYGVPELVAVAMAVRIVASVSLLRFGAGGGGLPAGGGGPAGGGPQTGSGSASDPPRPTTPGGSSDR